MYMCKFQIDIFIGNLKKIILSTNMKEVDVKIAQRLNHPKA